MISESEMGEDALAQALEEVGEIRELDHEPRAQFVDEVVGPVLVSFFDD